MINIVTVIVENTLALIKFDTGSFFWKSLIDNLLKICCDFALEKLYKFTIQL